MHAVYTYLLMYINSDTYHVTTHAIPSKCHHRHIANISVDVFRPQRELAHDRSVESAAPSSAPDFLK